MVQEASSGRSRGSESLDLRDSGRNANVFNIQLYSGRETMTAYKRTLTVSSSSRQQLIDITREVIRFVEDSGISDGILMVSVPHATSAVIANENERGLLNDILNRIREIFPQSFEYAHNRMDDNADAHLAATFLGHSRMFPVEDHRLVRGTWQNIFVVELDGPRTRREVHLNLVS